MKLLSLSINGVQINPPGNVPTGGLEGTGSTGMNLIQLALTLLFVGADILAVIFVIYAGIQWVMSGGDKQKIQSARNRLVYSIIGLIIISLSLFIVNFISTFIFGGGGGGAGPRLQ